MKKDSVVEFYLDDLSDCLDSSSASDTDGKSDNNDVTIRKRRSILPLIFYL